MVNQSDEPLRKVTLNLYEADMKWIEDHFEAGIVSQMIRQVVRRFVRVYKEDGCDVQ